MFQGFTMDTSRYLWELAFHNEKPWFEEHREEYLRLLKEPFQTLAEEVLAELPLLAGEEVPRISFGQMFLRMLKIACLAG